MLILCGLLSLVVRPGPVPVLLPGVLPVCPSSLRGSWRRRGLRRRRRGLFCLNRLTESTKWFFASVRRTSPYTCCLHYATAPKGSHRACRTCTASRDALYFPEEQWHTITRTALSVCRLNADVTDWTIEQIFGMISRKKYRRYHHENQ